MDETELKEEASIQEDAGPESAPQQTQKGQDAEDPDPDEDFGWDDVQEEMQASAKPLHKEEAGTVRFKELRKGDPQKGTLDLDCILDIPLTLTVELGRNRMLISDLLELNQGSVIELTKLAGEPMDVFANNKLIARGEVVVVNEKFGIRLIEIVSHAERLNKLK